MKKPYLKKNNEQGFSLVEFIVVLVIFSIMSGTSFFNFNRYQDNIEQTNIAQDLALTLRQAQVYGLSASDRVVGNRDLEDEVASDVFDATRNNSSLGKDVVNIATDRSVRGVAINTATQEFIIFEDNNQNLRYDANTGGNFSDRIIDVRKILARNVVIGVCLIGPDKLPANVNDCSESVRDSEETVDITFQRPYPDAHISYDGNNGYKHAFIMLYDRSYSELPRYIEISSIGNISVRKYEG